MNNIVNINEHEKTTQAAIDAEACSWIVQLHDAQPTAADLETFRSWLQRSPAHLETFRQFAKTWTKMDVLSELVFSEIERATEAVQGQVLTEKSEGTFLQLRYVMFSMAFLMLALTSGLIWKSLSSYSEQPQFSAEYSTVVGEQKQVSLPDGSGIRLNTKSKTNVTYKKDARLIHLVEGEAHFNVFHDSEKPFVVYAGKVAVKAVGTSFSVYLKDDSVDVIVTDGEVKISSLPKDLEVSRKAELELINNAETVASFVQGQRAVFKDKIELVENIELQEIEKKLSWRDGILIFEGDRLQDVVKEVSRYTPTKIIILDNETRNLKIGGYFRAGEIVPMLDTFEQSFSIEVEQISENLVYLSRKIK